MTLLKGFPISRQYAPEPYDVGARMPVSYVQNKVGLLPGAIGTYGAWELRLLSTCVTQVFVEIALANKSVSTTVAGKTNTLFSSAPRPVLDHGWYPFCNK